MKVNMTKINALNNSKKPASAWNPAGRQNTHHRRSARSKNLTKQMRDFEAAMASKKQQGGLSKPKPEHEAKPEQTKPLDEPGQRDRFAEGVNRSGSTFHPLQEHDTLEPDNSYGKKKTEGLSANCRQAAEFDQDTGCLEQTDLDLHGGYEEEIELAASGLPPDMRIEDRAEPLDLRTTDQPARVDFQRYRDIIEKISVNTDLQDNSKDVNIKFTDKTLDGAQVMISKSGDRVRVRWITSSGSIYRLLSKQRFDLQQHLYGHLGIKSDVSVDFKKESRPRFARQKATGRLLRFQTPKS
jgi:hypothetical protein